MFSFSRHHSNYNCLCSPALLNFLEDPKLMCTTLTFIPLFLFHNLLLYTWLTHYFTTFSSILKLGLAIMMTERVALEFWDNLTLIIDFLDQNLNWGNHYFIVMIFCYIAKAVTVLCSWFTIFLLIYYYYGLWGTMEERMEEESNVLAEKILFIMKASFVFCISLVFERKPYEVKCCDYEIYF